MYAAAPLCREEGRHVQAFEDRASVDARRLRNHLPAGRWSRRRAIAFAGHAGRGALLIVTMRAADYFKTIMPAIVQQLKPAIVQNRPQVERDYDAIMPLMLDSMNARVSEIIEQVAALYARNFTAAELNEVVAFYRGPTGQKFIQKLPLITQESMVIGQRFGQSIAAELRSRIVAELRKRGHDI